MAKSKGGAPKAAFPRSRPLAAQLKLRPKKANPFELKGTKNHFDTIGRRSAGVKKNVIKAREEAVNRRKKTLLVEYKQLRKANTFVDRRFGENDPELTEADKGLARVQAQRVKQGRKAKYTLSEPAGGAGGDGGSTQLTHLGKSLADMDDFSDRPDLDDLDDDMVEQLMTQYQFGGGDSAEGGAGQQGRQADGRPKSRKEIMEEIIAKSKMYRALKIKQREEDEAALEQLNEQFHELKAQLAAIRRPAGWNKAQPKSKADDPGDAAYDVAARELAFEAKGAAGERTLSPEELMERERQRLEALEKQRVKRMRGEPSESEEEEEEGEEEGGRRGKRGRQASGDALGGDFDSEDEEGEDEDEDEGEDEDEDEDEDGPAAKELTKLEQRRMQAAAGSHPLQESFRAAIAALAEKHKVALEKNPFLEEGEEGEEEDEDEEGDEGEAGESGDEEEQSAGSSSDDADEDEDEGEDEEALDERRHPKHAPSTSAPTPEAPKSKAASAAAAAQDGRPGHKPQDQQQQARAKAKAAGQEPAGSAPLDLPFTIPLPASYAAFAALAAGRPAEQLAVLITRIRAFNAAALATDNKRKMQEFYGILVQHFAMLAGQQPVPAPSLDVLHSVLLEMTPQVPYYAATVARARLQRMSEHLTKALSGLGGAVARDAAEAATAGQLQPHTVTAGQQAAKGQPGQGQSPWPGARVLLQLKLFTSLFPVSDRRHPVITPLALLVGKYLDQCPVSNLHDAAAGLFLCSLMLHVVAPAKRHAPEALNFVETCLRSCVLASPSAATAAAPWAQPSNNDDAWVRVPSGLLAPSSSTNGNTGSGEVGSAAPPALIVYEVLSAQPSDPRVSGDAFKLSLLRCALCAARRAGELAEGSMCFQQAFAPLLDALALVGKRLKGQLPLELEELRSEVAQRLAAASAACVAGRMPMVQEGRGRASAALPGVVPAHAVREFNPRFEEEYVTGRDYDPDRSRAEARRLKRQVTKERRGAMRELRRDAVFMAEERDRERAGVDAERLDSQRKFYSELQRQEADMRSGGQGGINPHKKKKKK